MARITRETLQLGVFFVLAAGTASALALTSMAKKAAKVEHGQQHGGGGRGGRLPTAVPRFPGLD